MTTTLNDGEAGLDAMGRDRTRTWLAIVLVFALVVRLGWALTRPSDDASLSALPDQTEYVQLGRSLLAGQGLSVYDARFEQRLLAQRAPGYPLLVAACGGNLTVLRAVQAVLDTSAALAAYLLARRWLDSGPALAAAIFVAINPFLIYFCGLALTETLYTAMLAWGMVMLGGAAARFDRWLWLGGATLLALSVLVRPGSIGLPVVLALLATIVRGRAAPLPAPAGAVMLVLLTLILAPWAARNRQVLGSWIWTTTNGGITAFDGFNPDASGNSDQRFVVTMPHLREMDEVQRDRYLASQARQFVLDHPRRAWQLALVKMARTWSPLPLSEQFRRMPYVLIGLGYSVPFAVLVLAGLIRKRDGLLGGLGPAAKAFLAAPALYLTVTAALSVGSLRYRIPAEVPMAVIAAATVGAIAGRRELLSERALEFRRAPMGAPAANALPVARSL